MSRFYPGRAVTLYVKGAGVVSEEIHEVESVGSGIVKLVNSDREYDATTGKWLGEDDLFGFDFWIEEA